MQSIPTIKGYDVHGEIGRGGMGVVFRATDTTLGRQVAIKALPDHLAHDPERRARFDRESRTLASVNHPNVAQIFGVETVNDKPYIILEYVEGETLADRLDRGSLTPEDAVDICTQVALGVEAAHNAGVIHRDLKPANIRITPEGIAKVLDFGLARADESASSTGSALSQSPTLTTPHPIHSPTVAGAILGTAPYMSPEQARGRSVDKRTDIWSFGVVLYECLAGASPFVGETLTDSIGAILHKDPDYALLSKCPPALTRTMKRCLERDKNRRYHDIADARIELEDSLKESDEVASQSTTTRLPIALLAIIAIIFAASASALSMFLTRPATPKPVLAQINLPPNTRPVFAGDLSGPPTISPDGSTIAFAAQTEGQTQRLYIQRLDSPDAIPLRGTEGATFPFWSPDSKSIAFFANSTIRRVDLASKTTFTICDAISGRGGTWFEDGSILFAPKYQSGLSVVPAQGGQPRPLTEPDTSRHSSHRWPVRIPGTNQFLFVAIHHDPALQEDAAIYLGSLDGSPPTEVMRAISSPQYADGKLLFVREGVLLAVPLDTRTGKLTGDPMPVLSGIAVDMSTWFATFSVSNTGVIAYQRLIQDPNAISTTAGSFAGTSEATLTTTYYRDGRPLSDIIRNIPHISLIISPDGTSLAVTATPELDNNYDIWIKPITDPLLVANGNDLSNKIQQGTLADARRLTYLPGAEVNPVWSPDGTEVAFGRIFVSSNTGSGIYRTRVGGGTEKLVLNAEDDEDVWPSDWSRDNRYIIYTKGHWIGGEKDIWAIPLFGDKQPFPVVEDAAEEGQGVLSPDGKWLAYRSFVSNQDEVYVIPFEPGWSDSSTSTAPPTGSRWRVSIAGGTYPVWRDDGKELFYIAPNGSLVAVPVQTDSSTFSFDIGVALFQTSANLGVNYDVFPGGQSFIINRFPTDETTPISLILNWQSLLKD